jgi:hypothetical protein
MILNVLILLLGPWKGVYAIHLLDFTLTQN